MTGYERPYANENVKGEEKSEMALAVVNRPRYDGEQQAENFEHEEYRAPQTIIGQ